MSPRSFPGFVSSASRAPTALSFSYEFKFKLPAAGSTAGDAPTLSVHASVPDTRTRSSWTADIVFSADTLRAGETMAFNFVEADCGTLDEFLDQWHQVRVQLKLDNYTGSVWVDGRLVLDGVPLRQTPDAALIPELLKTCGADKPSGLRVEDIEVKYRDQILKPKNEGEEVSQSIVSDSFETYRAGVFPRSGGWLTGMEKIAGLLSEIRPGETPAEALSARPADSLKDKGKRLGNAKTGAERESRGSEVLQSGGQAAQALNLSDGALENGAALIDEEDSVSGLRSFRLETVGIESVSVVKRFSLPDRVPFGVSGGSFAIGVEPSDSQRGTGLRAGLDRESRLDGRSGKLGKENDPVTGPTSGVKNERNLPADSRSAETRPDQGSAGSGKTMKTLSASPVGNYYLYSFDGKLLQTYNVYGVLLKDYIYMGDRLIAEHDHVGSRFLYYTPDQINSTRIVTDSAGTVVYSAAHDPYGGIQQIWVNTFDPTPKFSGKERDAESGLDYFGARYYDKAQYRFISVDPETNPVGCAAQPQLWHLFGYCRNNPLAFIDPDGAASFALNRLTFLADSNSAVLKGNYGRSDVPDQVLDIKITMDQTGKFSIDVKATGWVVLANPRDNIWARLDTLLSNYTENRVLLHEHRHLTYIEKYVLKKLEKLELTLNSDKVSPELHKKIWGWIDEAKAETRAAMDSVWGLVMWSETILYLSGKGI